MASTNLARTPSSAGSTTTGTFSFWIKGNLATGSNQNLYSVSDGGNTWQMWINVNGQLDFHAWNGSSYVARVHPERKLRDVNAWYHIVCTIDTTNATAGDRLRLYINGERYTGAWTAEVQPSQNLGIIFCKNSTTRIGSEWDNSDYFEGVMSHFHLIDGTAYDASAFGETDATTGIWKPKTAPSVTYGTNGFFLKFENSGAFGTDSSGNSNTFTVNGTMTQTIDTPSNVFCTLNPLVNIEGSYTLSNGNTKFTGTGTNDNCYGTLGVTQGKWYFETKWTANVATAFAGWTTMELGQTQGTGNLITKFVGQYRDDYTINFGTTGTTNTSVSANDIFGFYLDLDSATKTCKIYQNDVLIATENIPTARVGEAFTPCVGDTSATNGIIECNFGNGFFGTTAVSSGNSDANGEGIFEYNPTLSGVNYLTLNTKNINAEEYS